MTEQASEVTERARDLLRRARRVVVAGVSSNPARDSYDVARYLIDVGYDVALVNPVEDGPILGRPVYDSIRDVPGDIDIVDIFRRPEFVGPLVEDAIAAGAKAVWMQLGIINEDAAAQARAAGLEVVMDRCTKIEHRALRSG